MIMGVSTTGLQSVKWLMAVYFGTGMIRVIQSLQTHAVEPKLVRKAEKYFFNSPKLWRSVHEMMHKTFEKFLLDKVVQP